jgi:transcription-repair coupling factor (superfamily II helicase)
MQGHAERDIEQAETNLRGRAERGEIVPLTDPLCQTFEEAVKSAAKGRQTVMLSLLARSLPFLRPEVEAHLRGVPAPGFGGRPSALADALATYLQNNVRVAVVSVQAPRVRGLMNERKLPEAALATLVGKHKGGVALVNGALTQGFALPDARLVVLTDAELFGANDKKSPKRRQEFRGGLRLTSLLDLKPGDYVVHIHHGIGQFRG